MAAIAEDCESNVDSAFYSKVLRTIVLHRWPSWNNSSGMWLIASINVPLGAFEQKSALNHKASDAVLIHSFLIYKTNNFEDVSKITLQPFNHWKLCVIMLPALRCQELL